MGSPIVFYTHVYSTFKPFEFIWATKASEPILCTTFIFEKAKKKAKKKPEKYILHILIFKSLPNIHI